MFRCLYHLHMRRILVTISTLTIFTLSIFVFYSTTNLEKRAISVNSKLRFVTVPSSSKQVFEARKQYLRDICKKQGHPPPSDIIHSKLTYTFMYETRHKIVYCPLEKAASTFWKNILTATEQGSSFQLPFPSFPLNEMNKGVQTFGSLIKSNSSYKYKYRLKNATSLIVVRNPYTKLFSGYVDKLYHPNSEFWRIWGKSIKKLMIKLNMTMNNKTLTDNTNETVTDKTNMTEICGHDITFAQFIKYIIVNHQKNHTVDEHFQTATKHCKPCRVKYDYIGKFETLKKDTKHILKEWSKKIDLDINFGKFYNVTKMDSVRKRIKLSMQALELDSKNCEIKPSNFHLRTWRYLQITGIIPKHVKMPLSFTTDPEIVTFERFAELVEKLIELNKDFVYKEKQRHEALVQAYRTISLDDMEQLREVVKGDCLYFQYADRPSELFDRNGVIDHGDFNYFDGL